MTGFVLGIAATLGVGVYVAGPERAKQAFKFLKAKFKGE